MIVGTLLNTDTVTRGTGYSHNSHYHHPFIMVKMSAGKEEIADKYSLGTVPRIK